MKDIWLKALGLVVTLACWMLAAHALHSRVWTLLLICFLPLLQFPITLMGRKILQRQAMEQAQRITLLVHYSMMIVLGCAIFSAIQIIRAQVSEPSHLRWPIPLIVGRALVQITGWATLISVLNLAIRGLGAPFAAKLSSRLATDWMYAWTRNPMVLCTFAFLFSVGLRYQSLWFLVWLLGIATPGWLFFVYRYEELELKIRFGQAYLDYRSKTPFLWPRKPRITRSLSGETSSNSSLTPLCDDHHTLR